MEFANEFLPLLERLNEALPDAKAVLIGAKYGFTDMYTGGFFLSPLCIQSTEFHASTFFSRSLRDCLLPRTYP